MTRSVVEHVEVVFESVPWRGPSGRAPGVGSHDAGIAKRQPSIVQGEAIREEKH